MLQPLLSILRCPYCGGRLRKERLRARGAARRAGVLSCYCCAFPMIDGVVVMTADPRARRALQQLRRGHERSALASLLQDDDRGGRGAIAKLRLPGPKGERASFRDLVRSLVPGAEGDYLLHRFSDPTFLRARTLARAVWAGGRRNGAVILDLCGGAGHLARFLRQLAGSPEVVLADRSFRKLWLARRLLPSDSLIVCCDAEQPLPFADAVFQLSVCADAFHYIWHKRLLASELRRVTGHHGAVMLAHLHNALGWNYSQGDALPPQGYREIFNQMQPRLLREADIPFDLPGINHVDLKQERPAAELARSPALSLVASRNPRVFRRRKVRSVYPTAARVNPLYRRGSNGDAGTWRLTFPSPEYADEYAESAAYLPREFTGADERSTDRPTFSPRRARELARRGVLLDLPDNYA